MTKPAEEDQFAKLVMQFHKNAVDALKRRNMIPLEKKVERAAVFDKYKEQAIQVIINSGTN